MWHNGDQELQVDDEDCSQLPAVRMVQQGLAQGRRNDFRFKVRRSLFLLLACGVLNEVL